MSGFQFPRLFLSASCLLFAAGGIAAAAETAAAEPAAPAASPKPCRIEVVDKATGWPVPLVILETTNQIRFVTDNAGVAAIDLPEAMGRELWFNISSPGYEIPKDGFGSRGVRFVVKPGMTKRIEIKRNSIARRVGRLTGGGLLAESQKCGDHLDWKESGPFGCDSVQAVPYRGRLFWLWGDTNVAHYPLGIFDTTGATSAVPKESSLVPPLKLPFTYFRAPADEHGNQRVRAIAKIAGKGPTWLWGMTSVPDAQGNERLVATYEKTPGSGSLESIEWGLVTWNDKTERFEQLKTLWKKGGEGDKSMIPVGSAAQWTDAGGKKWVVFGNPLPRLRCPATFESWSDPGTWKRIEQPKELPSAGGGKPIRLHSGGIAYNSYRKRWVAIFMENYGMNNLGNVWYAEADQPTGPWGPAVKVLSHDNYTFYNPIVHPEFSADGSKALYFEGTYTRQFTDRARPTPRYDYNQILYRVDLDNPALKRAQAPATGP